MTEGVGGACGNGGEGCSGGGGGSTIISLLGWGSAGSGGGGGGGRWAGLGGAADAKPPVPCWATGAGLGPSGQL